MSGKVVIGDDGSDAADVAWHWLNNHRWPGWQLEALTAVEPPRPLAPSEHRDPVAWTPSWNRDVVDRAEFASVEFLTAEGDPRVLLGDLVDVDLMVVGAHDRSPLKALWVGSTTEWLLHRPPAPLAIIRAADVMRQVVVCTDGSSHSERALDAFVGMPSAADTAVTLACVDDGHVDTDAALARAQGVLDGAGISTSVEQLSGKPRHVIPGLLADRKPDLAVLGTRGLTGWHRLRFGSTAAAVIHTTHGSALFACAGEPQD